MPSSTHDINCGPRRFTSETASSTPVRSIDDSGDLIGGQDRECVPFVNSDESPAGRIDAQAIRVIADDFPHLRQPKRERSKPGLAH